MQRWRLWFLEHRGYRRGVAPAICPRGSCIGHGIGVRRPFDDDSGEVEEKLLGIYTQERNGLDAIPRFVILPGFRDHPDGFELEPIKIGNFSWKEGFDGPVEEAGERHLADLDGAAKDFSSIVYVVDHEYEFPPEFDNTRFIGLFATQDDANRVIGCLLNKPGFRDHVDGFTSDRYLLNNDYWDEGYIRVTDVRSPT